MGLAIAVVIISVGILFLVTLSLSAPQTDSTATFQEDQFTQNLLDAYLKTSNPDCPQRSVARYFVWNVTGIGSAQCQDPNTWDKLNQTLDTAITTYIGREYKFEVRRDVCADVYGEGSDCVKQIQSGNCDPQTQSTGRAGRQTLTKHPLSGEIEIILWLCQAQ